MLLQGAVQCAGGMGGLKWHNIAVPQGTTPAISMSMPLSSHRLYSQAASLCGMEGDASKLFSVSQGNFCAMSNGGRSQRLTCTAAASSKSQNGSKSSEKMVVAITGATGFIGSKLVQRLVADGHEVRILTRSVSKARDIFPERAYPGVQVGDESRWADLIQGSTGVVNLAGPPISTRWTPEVKADIKNCRVAVTSKVVAAINSTPKEKRPSVLVSSTAVGFYGTSETSVFDETSPSGKDYLAEVCKAWEATARRVRHGTRLVLLRTGIVLDGQEGGSLESLIRRKPTKIYRPSSYFAVPLLTHVVCREWEEKAKGLENGTRLVLIRTGIVLDKDGGALAKMVPIFSIFAGGPLGSGKQWFSWVHRDDLVSLIMESLTNPAYEGVINGTAPNPVRMAEMCDRLGAILGRPSWLPVPEFALKAILGEGATVVLEGQRVLPKKAQELGFSFKYRYISDALKAILTT